jgi:hypothetical protein
LIIVLVYQIYLNYEIYMHIVSQIFVRDDNIEAVWKLIMHQ